LGPRSTHSRGPTHTKTQTQHRGTTNPNAQDNWQATQAGPSCSLVSSLSLRSLSCCGLCALPPGVSGAPAVRSTWAQALYRGREQQGRWERRYSRRGYSQAFCLSPLSLSLVFSLFALSSPGSAE
jgi:hypothetical protein